MKITLNKEEIQTVLEDALCNGGLSCLGDSGIELDYKKTDYIEHKETGDCYETVLMKMLNNGKALSFIDEECDGEYSVDLTLKLATERLTDITDKHLSDTVKRMLDEESDAEDGYVLIQFILYNEVIFG